ncbi:MAG: O-antigen ligase family protein [Kiritimatiellia bacterium]
MSPFTKSSWRESPLLMMLCLGVLILPVSNALGQVPLYLASVMWLMRVLRGKIRGVRSTWIFAGGFVLLIVLSLFTAVHPEMGLNKLNRLLIFPLTGAVTAACLGKNDTANRLKLICGYLVAGVCAMGLYDLFRFPMEMRNGVRFEDVGDMTSPQFYLVGLMIWLGLLSAKSVQRSRFFWWALPLLVAGLLVHQKRGVWLAAVITVFLWTVWSRHWKTLLVLVCLGGLSLSLPFVQTRLHHLKEVIQPTHGGRMILWTQVSPRLFEKYPGGMGYNGSTYEDFREVLPREYHMEEGLRHLHNNVLQIRLELGWPGVMWWSLWMMLIAVKAFKPASGEMKPLQAAVAFGFLGLMLNGLVEYNFGDSEVMKLYFILFGMVDVFPLVNSPRFPLALYSFSPYKPHQFRHCGTEASIEQTP